MIEPYYKDDHVTIYNCSYQDIIADLTPQYEIIITDPPYGTGGWRRTTSGAGSDPKGNLIKEDWDIAEVDWITGTVPVITFWPSSGAWKLLSHANYVELDKHRTLYWEKPDPKPQISNRTKWSIEPIWILSKEGFLLYGETDLYTESSIRLNRNTEAVGHPYQKPETVMRWLLQKTIYTKILDPFMGSGTTLRAAKDLGKSCIGIEINERFCELAAKRMQQEVLGLI